MILHLIQWYLLIGCVVAGILIMVVIIASTQTDFDERKFGMVETILMVILWPYFLIIGISSFIRGAKKGMK